MKASGREPVVIVGNILNRTSEHINTEVISKSLEYELLNSGKVKFVASPEEREQMRAERADQQKGFTSPETMARLGREHGAD
jgi:PBP1b-binding outer membrane lipoprotein LpoB